MLVPLYLLITADLHLHGVQYAALLVTIYGVATWRAATGAGMLADRFESQGSARLGAGAQCPGDCRDGSDAKV